MPPVKLTTGGPFNRKRKKAPSSSSSTSTSSSSAHASDPNYEDPVQQAAEEVFDDEPEMSQAEETVGPIFFRNMDQGRSMEYFKNKKYENTKTLVRSALETMGVHDQFFSFTNSLGFESRFWDLKEKSYNRLTAEFLSSFKLRREGDLVAFDFQLLDKQFSATELEIAAWFRFLPGGQEEVDYPVTLWKIITDTVPPANKDSPRAKYIQHPVLRVIQRAVAQTIFARGESAIQVRQEELGLLGRIVQPSIPRANLAVWMINYWASIAANRRKGKGQIQIGQFITKIAKEKGLRLRDLEETKGYDKMDISFWEKAEFIKKASDGPYVWKLTDYPLFYLPITQEVIPRRGPSYLLKNYRGEYIGMTTRPTRPVSPSLPPQQARRSSRGGATSSTAAPPDSSAFDFGPLYERLDNIARLSNESIELGRNINARVTQLEEEQRLARADINLLLSDREENARTRGQVGELYDWLFPHYGHPPPPPQN